MRKQETQTQKSPESTKGCPSREDASRRTLLVFNCYEAWVYQLRVLGYDLDIIVGLKGRYKPTWDEQMRPVPPNSRLITLQEAQQSQTSYYCIITHSTTDLLDIKHRPEPRLMVVHSTLEGCAMEEGSDDAPQTLKETLHKYLKLVGGHVVAVSMLKGKLWGFTEDIVPVGSDPDDYLPYSGEIASGLRISNFIQIRKQYLLWDLHEKAFDGIPVRIVGHNPDMRGVRAANSWDHLKRTLQSHRFYIHTANPELEDGYNMATVEAMAAGMPVLGNRHPTSPIKHGISGFLSDDPAELRKYAGMLLEDRILATMMGKEARKTAIERFSMTGFKEAFLRSIETARRKWKKRKLHR
ncbi:MAG TPA: glycosyltransferase [Sedimentisphaerales bacterium]|nr:glycosyltransferase [Sedimentisphaerales bacterium]